MRLTVLLGLLSAQTLVGLFTQDIDGIESGPLTYLVSYLLLPDLGAELDITLWMKDEGLNPTGSFKARGLVMAVSMGKALGIMQSGWAIGYAAAVLVTGLALAFARALLRGDGLEPVKAHAGILCAETAHGDRADGVRAPAVHAGHRVRLRAGLTGGLAAGGGARRGRGDRSRCRGADRSPRVAAWRLR